MAGFWRSDFLDVGRPPSVVLRVSLMSGGFGPAGSRDQGCRALRRLKLADILQTELITGGVPYFLEIGSWATVELGGPGDPG